MATISGQITVTTAGTAVRGPDVSCNRVLLKAKPTNTGHIYLGDVNGDVDAANGFPLSVGHEGVNLRLNNLSELWFDASVNGQVVCWLLV